MNSNSVQVNTFQQIIPDDAYIIRKVMHATAKCSLSSNVIRRHFVSTVCATAALATTILSVPAYVLRAACEFTAKLITLHVDAAFVTLAVQMMNAGKSLLLTLLSVAYIFGGLFFPDKIYPYVTPQEQPDVTEILQKNLASAEQRAKEAENKVTEAEQKITEAEGKAEAAAEELRALNAGVHYLEEDIKQLKGELGSAKQDLARKDLALTKLEGERKQEQQRLDDVEVENGRLLAEQQQRDAKLKSYETRLQDHASDLAAARDEVHGKAAAKRQEIATLQQSLSEKEEELKTVREDLQDAEEEVKQLKADKETGEATRRTLATQATNHLKRATEAESNFKTAQAALRQGAAEIRTLSTNLNQMTLNFQHAEHLRKEAEREKKALAADLAQAKTDLKAARKDQSRLRKSIAGVGTPKNGAAANGAGSKPSSRAGSRASSPAPSAAPECSAVPPVANGKHTPAAAADEAEKKTVAIADIEFDAKGKAGAPIEKPMLIDHPSAVHKYTLLLQQYGKLLSTKSMQTMEKEAKGEIDGTADNAEFRRNLHLLLKTMNLAEHDQDYGNNRKRYQEHFIPQLRELIKCKEYERLRLKSDLGKNLRTARGHVFSICYNRWAKTEIYSYLKAVLELATGEIETKTLKAENFADTVAAVNKRVPQMKDTFALAWQKFHGTIGKDYTGTENTPHVRGTFVYIDATNGSKKINFMRHGSPTVEDSFSLAALRAAEGALNTAIGAVNTGIQFLNNGLKAVGIPAQFPKAPTIGKVTGNTEIASDYAEFLIVAAEKKQGILYCIHQRMQPEDGVEDESERVNAILALQTKHPNFHAFVQSVEGPLFERKPVDESEAKGANEIEALKNTDVKTFKQFKAKILWEFDPNNKKRTCHLPNAIMADQNYFTKVMPGLLDDVHRIFFGNRDDIILEKDGRSSLAEWQSFILLFYVFQKIDLKFRLDSGDYQIKHYTTACKDFLDRGGAMALVEERMHDYWAGKEGDPQILEERLVNTIAPAILVKKIGVIDKRLQPALVVDKLLFNMSAADKKALREYRFPGGWHCTGIEIPKHPNQTGWK